MSNTPSCPPQQRSSKQQFAAAVEGLPVVASATFIQGECKQIVCEGVAAAAAAAAADTAADAAAAADTAAAGGGEDTAADAAAAADTAAAGGGEAAGAAAAAAGEQKGEDMKYLISNSLTAAEKSIVPFLAAA
ncbi:hypothetical protein, conserved, partial [Eimeria brunetti]